VSTPLALQLQIPFEAFQCHSFYLQESEARLSINVVIIIVWCFLLVLPSGVVRTNTLSPQSVFPERVIF